MTLNLVKGQDKEPLERSMVDEITWNLHVHVRTTSQSNGPSNISVILTYMLVKIQIFFVILEIHIHKQLYLKAKVTMVIKGVQSLIFSPATMILEI